MSPVRISCAVALAGVAVCFLQVPPISGTTTPASQDNTTNQSDVTTVSNVHIRSPPTKSLFNSQLFQSDNFLGGVMKTFANALPLRESYIAFEQAHPQDTSSQEFDDYFKPSRYPYGGFGGTGSGGGSPPPYYYSPPKLQNSYPQSPSSTLSHSPFYSQESPSPFYVPHYPGAPPPRQSQPPQRPPFIRLVKIPGRVTYTINGGPGGRNDLEMVCEFPPYILMVQQIYWHVIPPPSSLLLPYGTFYDSRNGFAPRVTVSSISKWKSVLRVRDYTPDDYGTYRCVSTAVLPEEPEASYSVQLAPQLPLAYPTSYFAAPPDSLELRSASRKVEDHVASPSEHVSRESKVKFERKKRETGVYGVYAPFYKPHYGIYRIFKEVVFVGDPYGAGSEQVQNCVTVDGSPIVKDTHGREVSSNGVKHSGEIREKTGSSKEKQKGGRKFDLFTRRSKVLF